MTKDIRDSHIKSKDKNMKDLVRVFYIMNFSFRNNYVENC